VAVWRIRPSCTSGCGVAAISAIVLPAILATLS
jgi:hypothetical protein